MTIQYRPGVTGRVTGGARWSLVVGGVRGWGIARHRLKFRLYDHNGESVHEGSFDECLDAAAHLAKIGVASLYNNPDEEE